MVVSPEITSMPNDAAVRRLLRHHPKLHPRSVAAAELKALGLSKLPILEWELEQPWGHFVELVQETGMKPRDVEVAPSAPFQMPGQDLQVPPIFGFPLEAPRNDPGRVTDAQRGPGPETMRLAELDLEEKALLQDVLTLDRRDNHVPVPQAPRDAPNPRRRQLRPSQEEESAADSPPAPAVPKVAPPKHGRAAPRPRR
eukprot:symbB.v1.2.009434.t1/scaffold597.1/size183257/5